MPHFIKYLTNLRAHFIIKNRIAKNKVSIYIKPIFFFFKDYHCTNSNIWEPTLI